MKAITTSEDDDQGERRPQPLLISSPLSPLLQTVYGVLSAIEGMDTFRDVMTHTNIGPWYEAVKREVAAHSGAKRT